MRKCTWRYLGRALIAQTETEQKFNTKRSDLQRRAECTTGHGRETTAANREEQHKQHHMDPTEFCDAETSNENGPHNN